jgi:signal transduction histidine kinase
MKGTSIKIIYVYLILVSLFTFLAPNSFATAATDATAVTDKSETAQIHSLSGKWEFYWQRLLTPTEFRADATLTSEATISPDYIQVPMSWRGQSLGEQTNEGKPLPAHGYATYRKLLTVSPEYVNVNAALFFRYIDSAFRIWIDGVELEGAGTIGTSRQTEQPDLRMHLFYFTPRSQTVEIVIQVSNYSFREGGIVGEVKWANADVLVRDVFKGIAMQDILFICCFLLLSLYHLIVYFSRRTDASFLWLGLLTLWMGLRAFLLSEYLVHLLFPFITWEQIIRIEYIVETFVMISLMMFFHVMYPKDAHRLALWLTMTYSALLLVYLIVTPTEQFTSTLLYHWLGYVLILIYYFVYLGIVTVIRRREGAALNALGLTIIAAAILNDVLYYVGILSTAPLSSLAFLTFFFIQAINIAFKYSHLFRSNLRLTTELEGIVAEQTEELRQSNEQLLQFDDQRTKLLENIAHDLGSPIAGLQTHIYILENSETEAEQQARVLQLMKMNVQNLKRQAEDLYDLTGVGRNADALELQTMTIQQLWQRILPFFEEKQGWGQIELQFGDVSGAGQAGHENHSEASMLNVNLTGVLRVVQNYLDNAIKFSLQEPCPVRIDYRVRGDMLEFSLTDFGKGIRADELPHVFERFYKGDGNRKGIGLGLAIVKESIERQGGTVAVQSEEGKGSTFLFTLPLASLHQK